MSLSKRLLPLDDLSRREVETPQYGDVDEAYRVYEDVFAAGIWPNEPCTPDELCGRCVEGDNLESNEQK